jgi:mRNA interferase HigB
VHVISRKKLREFWALHPDAQIPLSHWFKVARQAEWKTFAGLRADFRSADHVGRFVVFNIGGNKYRLIAEVFYRDAVILVRHVLTHKDYSQGGWKSPPTT